MNVAGLPREVRASTRCVLWRREVRAGRPTKVPYVATAPSRRAPVDDPTTWSPFAMAAAAFQAGEGDGVGIVLGKGLVGVDFDYVRDPRTRAVSDDVMAMVAMLDSYTEVSPSGTGLHVLARGVLPPGGRRRGPVEMYDTGRFFTLTGRHVVGTPRTLEERTAALAILHQRVFGTATPPSPRPRPCAPRLLGDDMALLARAAAARNGAKFRALWHGDASGYPSHSEADLALCNLLAFWTGHDAGWIDRLFRMSGLMRPKWDARRSDESYGARTFAAALGRT
jgi:primase-polymerase (primpol)-like protein